MSSHERALIKEILVAGALFMLVIVIGRFIDQATVKYQLMHHQMRVHPNVTTSD